MQKTIETGDREKAQAAVLAAEQAISDLVSRRDELDAGLAEHLLRIETGKAVKIEAGIALTAERTYSDAAIGGAEKRLAAAREALADAVLAEVRIFGPEVLDELDAEADALSAKVQTTMDALLAELSEYAQRRNDRLTELAVLVRDHGPAYPEMSYNDELAHFYLVKQSGAVPSERHLSATRSLNVPVAAKRWAAAAMSGGSYRDHKHRPARAELGIRKIASFTQARPRFSYGEVTPSA